MRVLYISLLFLILVILITGCVSTNGNANISKNGVENNQYLLHKNITVTIFWVGESATVENSFISNNQSAWDGNWEAHYGGYDDPSDRKGFYPGNFTPKENPFYFAVPYNDFDKNGIKKSNGLITGSICEPICKNAWIRITKGNKTVYSQWEDVGPFEENDTNYVFGEGSPVNKINNNAGLDVSPAVRDYLGLKDIDSIDWQFVNSKDVPNGPWKDIMTDSQVSWN